MQDHMELGELEYHLAMTTDDIEASVKLHENLIALSLLMRDGDIFYRRSDGYWIELYQRRDLR